MEVYLKTSERVGRITKVTYPLIKRILLSAAPTHTTQAEKQNTSFAFCCTDTQHKLKNKTQAPKEQQTNFASYHGEACPK
jgi:hypothetical protein